MRQDIKRNDRIDAIADQVVRKMEEVKDPDLELDIYNLGLIYEMTLDDEGFCQVVITFTETYCDCTDTIPPVIIAKLKEIDMIKSVDVQVVWHPAWNPTRLSRYGRIFLGINPN